MREIFKRNGIFLVVLLMTVFCNTISAQNNENEGGFDWDGMNELDNIDIRNNGGNDDSWDRASLYWDTEPNDYGSNHDDYYEPYDWRADNNNQNEDPSAAQDPDKQTESKVVLTKIVYPGETHTQDVKVLRDADTSTEKKVIDLIVNGEKVGTVTFSEPQTDANGVDIYTKMTVEVFPECPIAITTITFDNPDTSTYDDSKQSIDDNRKDAITDLSLYHDLGIANFNTPINKEEDIVIIGSIAAGNNFSNNKRDPCEVAKTLSFFGGVPVFKKALQDIRNTPDYYSREYSISLGQNSKGNIFAGEMIRGEKSSVQLKHNIQGFLLDIHNHPSYRIHSGLDLYVMLSLSKLYPNNKGSFVLPNKEQVYAAVITDLVAAQVFVAKYLTDPKTKEPAHYPEFMAQEMVRVLSKMNSYSIESESKAKAFVLNKYRAGVTFYKQDPNTGMFYPLIIKEIKLGDGSVKYTVVPCV